MSVVTDVFERLRRDLLRQVEEEGLDPHADAEAIRARAADAVAAYQRGAHLGEGAPLHDPEDTTRRLVDALTRYGALTDLLERRDVEEVFIEGGQVRFIAGDGRIRTLAAPTTEEENRQIVERLLALTPRRLDTASPLTQARVLGGTARLTAAIPPVSERLSATIRRHTLRRDTLASLSAAGAMEPAPAAFLWGVMQGQVRLLVSGPPGAGKTSLLGALLRAVPGDRCIRCCEEIRELTVPLSHGAYYETRPPGLDGGAEISLRDLVKFVLAMRPDLIVVGEVRGAEAFELTRAANAGCGMACTIHANHARAALDALVHAAVMAGENVTEQALRAVFAAGVDLVVHCELRQAGDSDRAARRRVSEIIAVVPSLHGG
ncbi:MAG TPA: ATPase, T2SS/T4P/T4SS family, partial [Egibacteraceae bacterium]|nr:ATPase, T2SS/T4P/T4SS family [Egibacteraceae bacterium]